jgi:hypothetical protein
MPVPVGGRKKTPTAPRADAFEESFCEVQSETLQVPLSLFADAVLTSGPPFPACQVHE